MDHSDQEGLFEYLPSFPQPFRRRIVQPETQAKPAISDSKQRESESAEDPQNPFANLRLPSPRLTSPYRPRLRGIETKNVLGVFLVLFGVIGVVGFVAFIFGSLGVTLVLWVIAGLYIAYRLDRKEEDKIGQAYAIGLVLFVAGIGVGFVDPFGDGLRESSGNPKTCQWCQGSGRNIIHSSDTCVHCGSSNVKRINGDNGEIGLKCFDCKPGKEGFIVSYPCEHCIGGKVMPSP